MAGGSDIHLHYCPFQCGVTCADVYAIQLHVEDCPRNVYSPFKASAPRQVKPQDSGEEEWVQCPRGDCGEYLLIREFDEHLNLHDEAARPVLPPRAALRSSVATSTVPSLANGGSSRVSTAPQARALREPTTPGRLGKKELGPHAFEKAMPASVRKHLTEDALPEYKCRIGPNGKVVREATVENETEGLIRTLSDLCALDGEIQAAYLCHPGVKHIRKLHCDGNFCGYWNVQMVLTYLQCLDAVPGLSRLPDVLQIQNTIEDGWDNGICTYGRTETGGIKGTRKWIGTHEAVTYFMQLGIPVNALSFREEGPSQHPDYSANDLAVIHFLDHVEAYFMSGLEEAKAHRNSFITKLAPIYFQRHGHSMTIVGLERRKDGFRNLLVFDPSFATSKHMDRLLHGGRITSKPDSLLKPYRRTDRSLTTWNEFEIVVPRVPASTKATTSSTK